MAVLIEDISLVFRVSTIDTKFQGGWDAFAGRMGGPYLCTDGDIARLSVRSVPDLRNTLGVLGEHGIRHRAPDGSADEIVVIEQLRGPAEECGWVEWGTIVKRGCPISVARLQGSMNDEVAFPLAWSFEFSPSDLHRRVERHELPKEARFVGQQQGMHVYAEPEGPRRLYVRSDELMF